MFCDCGSPECEDASVFLCVVRLERKYSRRCPLYDGERERLERRLLLDVGLADGVLCRLEAVPRAALRLSAVSDDSRGRTRKVEPGNEPEGGRARGYRHASVPLPCVAACCP